MSSWTSRSPGLGPDQVVAILKAREPARIMTAIGNKQDNRWHLELKSRWVDQYNFYINFVRVCPYFPFSARVYLNQHHWLAQRLRERGIPVRQCGNAFLHCGNPEALQALADSLTPQDILVCGQKWLAALTALPHAPGARAGGVPASAVLRPDRVLRQPHLQAARGGG